MHQIDNSIGKDRCEDVGSRRNRRTETCRQGGCRGAGSRRGRLQVAGATREPGAQCLVGTARGVQQEQLDEAARGEDEEHLAGAEGSRCVRVSSWMERGLQPAGLGETLRVAGQAASRGGEPARRGGVARWGGESVRSRCSSSPERRGVGASPVEQLPGADEGQQCRRG